VIDVGYYLNSANNDWFHIARDGAFEGETGGVRVLLVDDSHFFRNMLKPLLEVAGYRVEAAESGQEVLNLIEDGDEFDIIVSDIEMPGLSGFELAEKVRGHEKWKNVPMIALSSHATAQDMEKGREVGFDDYVAKFDREALIEAIGQALSKNTGEAA
jgi:two-component system chemotaxis sensor kinase CheA